MTKEKTFVVTTLNGNVFNITSNSKNNTISYLKEQLLSQGFKPQNETINIFINCNKASDDMLLSDDSLNKIAKIIAV